MNEKLKTIKILHLAICAGTILAYFMIGELYSLDNLKMPTIDSSSVVYLAIPIIAFFLSNLLFKSQLKNVDPKLSLEDKFGAYQTASLVRWAVLEGAAFIILFYNIDFLIFGILIIIYLVLLVPTEDRIKRDLDSLYLGK